jgi:hypothetical protein
MVVMFSTWIGKLGCISRTHAPQDKTGVCKRIKRAINGHYIKIYILRNFINRKRTILVPQQPEQVCVPGSCSETVSS